MPPLVLGTSIRVSLSGPGPLGKKSLLKRERVIAVGCVAAVERRARCRVACACGPPACSWVLVRRVGAFMPQGWQVQAPKSLVRLALKDSGVLKRAYWGGWNYEPVNQRLAKLGVDLFHGDTTFVRDMNETTTSDLIGVGFTFDEVARIQAAVAARAGQERPSPFDKMQDRALTQGTYVEQLLASARLLPFFKSFSQLGVREQRDLRELTNEDLAEAGLRTIARRRFGKLLMQTQSSESAAEEHFRWHYKRFMHNATPISCCPQMFVSRSA